MTLAQRLHEAVYKLPRGEAQTVLLFASRPEHADACQRYVDAMPVEDLRVALVALIRAVAGYPEQRLDGDYPPNGEDA